MTRWWFQNMFYVHPYLGKIPILSNLFQLGWKHQLLAGHFAWFWRCLAFSKRSSLFPLQRWAAKMSTLSLPKNIIHNKNHPFHFGHLKNHIISMYINIRMFSFFCGLESPKLQLLPEKGIRHLINVFIETEGISKSSTSLLVGGFNPFEKY